MAVRLYLDSCALQRPLDGLTGFAEIAEAACVQLLVEWAERGRAALLWSAALEFECIQRIPQERLTWARCVRGLTRERVRADRVVLRRAREITVTLELSALDALHVASAEAGHALLVTVDMPMLRKCARRRDLLHTLVVDPMEAVSRERSTGSRR
ncbi:MAG: hypothetical protein HY825_14570 [Acidobacteria bacterium]|nr:hypothetical protein [Acidobacteriota bacterium]